MKCIICLDKIGNIVILEVFPNEVKNFENLKKSKLNSEKVQKM